MHVIDGTSRDPIGDYQAIQQELQLFDSDLAAKPQLVAYNKMDVPDSSDYWDSVQDFLLAQVCQFGLRQGSSHVRRRAGVQHSPGSKAGASFTARRDSCCLMFAHRHDSGVSMPHAQFCAT